MQNEINTDPKVTENVTHEPEPDAANHGVPVDVPEMDLALEDHQQDAQEQAKDERSGEVVLGVGSVGKGRTELLAECRRKWEGQNLFGFGHNQS